MTLGRGAHVRVTGKGRKERVTPLSKHTAAIVQTWLDERGGTPDDPLRSDLIKAAPPTNTDEHQPGRSSPHVTSTRGCAHRLNVYSRQTCGIAPTPALPDTWAMTFHWPDGDAPEGIRRIGLRLYSPTEFQLTTPFSYQARARANQSERLVSVPAETDPASESGFGVTDFASVPKFMWGMIASYGRQLPAALVHDHLCDELKPLTGKAKRKARDDADSIFLLALRDQSLGKVRVPRFRARLLWAGVSLARYIQFHFMRFLALLATIAVGWCVLIGLTQWLSREYSFDNASKAWIPSHLVWAAVWYFVAGGIILFVAALVNQFAGGTVGWLVAGLVLLASIAMAVGIWSTLPWLSNDWWLINDAGELKRLFIVGLVIFVGGSLLAMKNGDRLLPIIGVFVIPLLAPVVALTVIAQVILWIPDALAHGFGGVAAGPSPTLLR
jgi:hypothetical protein